MQLFFRESAMASKILSRLLYTPLGEPSIYEALRQQDISQPSDDESGAATAVEQKSLSADSQEHNGDFDAPGTAASLTRKSRPIESKRQKRRSSKRRLPNGSEILHPITKPDVEEADDDVPQSLLIEDGQDQGTSPPRTQTRGLPPPVPGPSRRGNHTKWRVTQEQQRLHRESFLYSDVSGAPTERVRLRSTLDPKDRALWMWANVENLDNFIGDAYDYYVGRGAWSIILHRMLRLLWESSNAVLMSRYTNTRQHRRICISLLSISYSLH